VHAGQCLWWDITEDRQTQQERKEMINKVRGNMGATSTLSCKVELASYLQYWRI
jgi:hypothetical protein